MSPDGQFMWTGTDWIPAPPVTTTSSDWDKSDWDKSDQVSDHIWALVDKSNANLKNSPCSNLIEFETCKSISEEYLLKALTLAEKSGEKRIIADVINEFSKLLEHVMLHHYSSAEFGLYLRELKSICMENNLSAFVGMELNGDLFDEFDKNFLEALADSSSIYKELIKDKQFDDRSFLFFPMLRDVFITKELPGFRSDDGSIIDLYEKSLKIYTELDEQSHVADVKLRIAKYLCRDIIFGIPMDRLGEFLHEMTFGTDNKNPYSLFIDVIRFYEQTGELLKLAIAQCFFGLFLAHRHGIPKEPFESIDYFEEAMKNFRKGGTQSLLLAPDWLISTDYPSSLPNMRDIRIRTFNEHSGLPEEF